jgi:sulfinoalanine decarboxylase/sulfinoalanine decarboxylase/aspartate 1-decarboxylase
VILTRERGVLHDTFKQSASYLFQSDEDEYNMGTMSIQCGRRNDALKLFAAWMHHGDAGYDRRITHLFDLASHAASIVEAEPGMTLSKPPESMTVCFEVDGKPSDELCERLRRDGLEVVGFAHVDGRRVIRLACVNAAATTADIDRFFEHLRAAADDCPDGDNALVTAARA